MRRRAASGGSFTGRDRNARDRASCRRGSAPRRRAGARTSRSRPPRPPAPRIRRPPRPPRRDTPVARRHRPAPPDRPRVLAARPARARRRRTQGPRAALGAPAPRALVRPRRARAGRALARGPLRRQPRPADDLRSRESPLQPARPTGRFHPQLRGAQSNDHVDLHARRGFVRRVGRGERHGVPSPQERRRRAPGAGRPPDRARGHRRGLHADADACPPPHRPDGPPGRAAATRRFHLRPARALPVAVRHRAPGRSLARGHIHRGAPSGRRRDHGRGRRAVRPGHDAARHEAQRTRCPQLAGHDRGPLRGALTARRAVAGLLSDRRPRLPGLSRAPGQGEPDRGARGYAGGHLRAGCLPGGSALADRAGGP